jgi:hypothetical protein
VSRQYVEQCTPVNQLADIMILAFRTVQSISSSFMYIHMIVFECKMNTNRKGWTLS